MLPKKALLKGCFLVLGIIPVFAVPKERKAEPDSKVYPKAMVHFVEPEVMPSFSSFGVYINNCDLSRGRAIDEEPLKQLKDNSY